MYSNPSNSDWSILLMTSLRAQAQGSGCSDARPPAAPPGPGTPRPPPRPTRHRGSAARARW